MTITATNHVQHLITGEWDSCSACSDRFQAQLQTCDHETAMVSCFVCRRFGPEEWAEAYLADLQADADQAITLGEDPAVALADLEEMAQKVQTAIAKGRQQAPLGEKEKIMNETTATLTAAADEILNMTDEQMAAKVDAQVAEAEKADAAEADFHSTFKNLFEKVDTGASLALPAGQYPVRIVGCTFRLSSQSQRPQMVVTGEVAKGDFSGTLITKYLTLGTTDKAQQFFAGQLRVLGIDDDCEAGSWREVARLISEIQMPVWAEVGPQTLWQGKAQTNVKWFNAVSEPAGHSGSVVRQSDLDNERGE